MIEMDLTISEDAPMPMQDAHDHETETFPERAIAEISDHLTGKKEIYKAICKQFEDVYGSLDMLEKRIEEDGVPPDDHTQWDDVIEWRNVVSNLDRLNYYNRILWRTQR